MPAKRRRPVVEEIVETKPELQEKILSSEPPVHNTSHMRVEEEVESSPIVATPSTEQQVAAYDEPPSLEVPPPVKAEVAAQAFLNSDDTPRRGTNIKLIFFVTIVTALIVGFIAGGVYVYVTGVTPEATPSPKPTPVIEEGTIPTSKPTPSPTVVPSSYSVSILNGSGVIGAAGKVKEALENGGFKVSGTGNAANYNFKNTVIQTKSTVPSAAVDLLKKALKDYVVEEGDALPPSSTFDIVVTVGKQ